MVAPKAIAFLFRFAPLTSDRAVLTAGAVGIAAFLHAVPPSLAQGVPARPLHPRASSLAGPLFRGIDPAESGIAFVNPGAPQRTNARGEVIFYSTSSGKDTAGGVALGDVDGDGLDDVFLTRPQGGCRLYRNRGGMKFEDVTAAVFGAAVPDGWATGATFADIDNDGDTDLFVCNFGAANQLYINDGNGRFSDQAAGAGLDYAGASIMMAFCDYDRDGDLDGYLLTNFQEEPGWRDPVPMNVDPRTGEVRFPPGKEQVVGGLRKPDGSIKAFPSGQFDRLYRNDAGTFTDVTEASGVLQPEMGLSATWWDYNADSWPDLYVANDFYGADRLYRNNGRDAAGTVTFTDVAVDALPHTPWYSMGSDAADIDNDGWLDFLASDMAGSTHYSSKVGMGEMDADGWFLETAMPRQYMRNALYVNTGTGRFLEAASLAGVAKSDWTWSVKFGDLDGDGRVDIFITNGMTRDMFNSDLKQQETGIMERRDFDAAARFWASREPKKDTNFAFRNAGDLRFEHAGQAWGLNHTGVSFGAALGDLDLDGDLDLVVNHFEENVSVYENRSPASRQFLLLRLQGTASPRDGTGAMVRLEADGLKQTRYATRERGYMSCGSALVHFGLGDSEVAGRIVVEWPSGIRQEVRNLRAGQVHTLVEPAVAADPPVEGDPGGNAASPWFARTGSLAGTRGEEAAFDDFARQPLLPFRLSQLGPGMAMDDIDGDGDADLCLGGPAGTPARILVNHGGDGFRQALVVALENDAAHEDMGCLFLDADGDGDADLYIASGGVECAAGAEDPLLRDRLYLNNGRGDFRPAPEGTLPDLRNSGSTVVAADVDRDGDLDLFVGSRSIPGRYPETPRSSLLRNENGRFSDATATLAPELAATGLVTSALWSDVDDDGWPDLLVTHDWGPVKLFRNRGGTLVDATAASGLDAHRGWWNGIAAGDIDGDGDIDCVATGFGLNVPYKATSAAPQLLYYGDFDGSGTRHIVEAEFEDGVCFPRRGFSCSSAALPHLRDKLKTFHNFAAAALPEIYPETRLDSAIRLQADMLETTVLVNDGKGRFRFQVLPRRAQIAPSFGVLLEDMDGDGNLDCVLAQNFFGPQRETVRMGGGVSMVLRGDGAGNFRVLEPVESGIVLPGDSKSLAIAAPAGSGAPGLVFGVNDADAVAFENRNGRSAGASGGWLRVNLHQASGANPRAIGARVTLVLGSGGRRTAEIRAGGGYLTQSAPEIWFGLGGQVPVEVRVRWPDGEESVHRIDAGNRSSFSVKRP